MASSRHSKSRHSKSAGLTFSKALLPAAVPVAGFALVVSAAAATAVAGPSEHAVASAGLVVADNPEQTSAVSRDFVRTDVVEDEARIARSDADEDGVMFATRDTPVRSAPNAASEAVATLDEGDEVTVTAQTSRGFTLVLHDDVERWVWSDHLDDEAPVEEAVEDEPADDTTESPQTEADSGDDSAPAPNAGTVSGDSPGASAANAALGQVGQPYRRGGNAPGGFDCSGLTQWAYAQAGVSLPRTSGAQSGFGTSISRADLSPGDLIHWPGHVAMYVGNGNVVHASRPGTPVQVVSIERGYGSAPTGYTRPWS